MCIAAAHVFEAILDEAHGTTDAAGEMRHENALLDAALDAIAAADVDVVMDADIVGGNSQRAGDLVRIFRHLDRGPDIEHVAPWIPRRGYAKGLDRHRRIASPGDAERQMARALGEVPVDVAPDEQRSSSTFEPWAG